MILNAILEHLSQDPEIHFLVFTDSLHAKKADSRIYLDIRNNITEITIGDNNQPSYTLPISDPQLFPIIEKAINYSPRINAHSRDNPPLNPKNQDHQS